MGAGRSGLFCGTRGGISFFNSGETDTLNEKQTDQAHSDVEACGSELYFTQENALLLLEDDLTIIKLYDKVRTLAAKEGYPIGTKGIVVSIDAAYQMCAVEILDYNYPKAIVMYRLNEVEAVMN